MRDKLRLLSLLKEREGWMSEISHVWKTPGWLCDGEGDDIHQALCELTKSGTEIFTETKEKKTYGGFAWNIMPNYLIDLFIHGLDEIYLLQYRHAAVALVQELFSKCDIEYNSEFSLGDPNYAIAVSWSVFHYQKRDRYREPMSGLFFRGRAGEKLPAHVAGWKDIVKASLCCMGIFDLALWCLNLIDRTKNPPSELSPFYSPYKDRMPLRISGPENMLHQNDKHVKWIGEGNYKAGDFIILEQHIATILETDGFVVFRIVESAGGGNRKWKGVQTHGFDYERLCAIYKKRLSVIAPEHPASKTKGDIIVGRWIK